MAHQVTERPNAYCFSKNEIRYVYSVDNLDRAGLYLEAKLRYKILNGNAKINWHVSEAAFDSNLIIKVNGEDRLTMFYTGVGTETVKGGDLVRLIVPIFVPWVGDSPYSKMRVLKNGEEVFNEFTADQDEPHWLVYEFTADADSVYTVVVYSKDEGDVPHTDDVDVEIEDPFSELTPWKLKPNADGSVYLPFQQYIESLLKFVMPSGNITNASSQVCFFYVATREIDDDHPDPDFVTTESAHIRLAIKAGIEKHRYSRNNFFVNYFDTDKPWFTWQPSNRMIWKEQPQYISAFLKAGTANGCILRIRYKTTAGVETTINTALTSEGFIIHFKVDPATLGIPTGQLYYYEIAILNGEDVVVNYHRFYINYDPIYKWKDMIAINSLGGIDTVRIAGEVTNSIDRTTEDSEGGFAPDEWSSPVKGHEASQSAIAYRRSYKGDVGHQRTIREQESLIDILLSRFIYQILDSRLVPIVINQKSLLLGKSTDKLASFPVEWMFSEENEVFTPVDINFGIGTDTEEY